MQSPLHCLQVAALLLPLAAPAPAPAAASPAETANIALRKQIAAPEVLLRVTVPPGDGATQSLDVSDTTPALVCSQVFGVLPFRTFHRQRFDSFTTCTCVSDRTAVCEPDSYYPTVSPGTPEAALAQEHSSALSDKFIQVLNAFSVQQTCFFEHLRGQKLSPPRPCAFSWSHDERPACDCAQPPAVITTEEEPETEAAVVTPPVQQESPKPTQEAPGATAPTTEATDPATARSTKDAVQSVIKTGQTAEVGKNEPAAESEVLDVARTSGLAGEVDGQLAETLRRPLVTESSHLRRVRSARRH